jgi:hypothetical protein
LAAFEQPPTWLALVNAAYLGEYLDRDSAMARVEANIEKNMQTVLPIGGFIGRRRGSGRRCGDMISILGDARVEHPHSREGRQGIVRGNLYLPEVLHEAPAQSPPIRTLFD